MSEDFKIQQQREILSYLARINLKQVFKKLVYEDPVTYFIDRLRELQEDPDAPEPDRPRVIFVIGPPQSGKTTFAKLLSNSFEMHYINLDHLIKNEIYFDSEIGRRLKELPSGEEIPLPMAIELLGKEIDDNIAELDYVVDGFPNCIRDALEFERQIIECRYVVLLHIPPEQTSGPSSSTAPSGSGEGEEEIEGESESESGSADSFRDTLFGRITANDEDDEYEKAAKSKEFGGTFETFEKNRIPLCDYFEALDKLKVLDARRTATQLQEDMAALLL